MASKQTLISLITGAALAFSTNTVSAQTSNDDDDIIPIILTLLNGERPAIYRCRAGLLKDLNGSSTSAYNINPQFVDVNGVTLFLAYHPSYGAEVWKTDGTAAGTTLLKDINPGDDDGIFGSGALDKRLMAKVGNQVFFLADDGTTGEELWVTDGTTTGTRLVKNISGTADSSDISNLTAFNGKLYFVVSSGVNGVQDEGLWVSDGTSAGTQLVKDVHPTNTSAGSQVGTMAVLGDKLIFRGDSSPGGYAVWISDGTTAGTQLLKDPNPTGSSSWPEEFVSIGNRVYFSAIANGHGRELWVTDGTTAGTQLVKDIKPGSDSGLREGNININFSFKRNPGFNGKLYFVADDGDKGRELWVSDGTSSGTQRVTDINPGSLSAFNQSYALESMAVFNGQLHFRAKRDDTGFERWVLDANHNLTFTDLRPGNASSGAEFLTASDDYLVFEADPSFSIGNETALLDRDGRLRIIETNLGQPEYYHFRDNGAIMFIVAFADFGVGLVQIECPQY